MNASLAKLTLYTLSSTVEEWLLLCNQDRDFLWTCCPRIINPMLCCLDAFTGWHKNYFNIVYLIFRLTPGHVSFLNPLFFVVDPTVDIPKPKVESLQSQQECNSSQLRWSKNFCVGALICGLQVLQWSLCAPILGVWWRGWLLWWLWWNGLPGENHLHPWRLQVFIKITLFRDYI